MRDVCKRYRVCDARAAFGNGVNSGSAEFDTVCQDTFTRAARLCKNDLRNGINRGIGIAVKAVAGDAVMFFNHHHRHHHHGHGHSHSHSHSHRDADGSADDGNGDSESGQPINSDTRTAKMTTKSNSNVREKDGIDSKTHAGADDDDDFDSSVNFFASELEDDGNGGDEEEQEQEQEEQEEKDGNNRIKGKSKNVAANSKNGGGNDDDGFDSDVNFFASELGNYGEKDLHEQDDLDNTHNNTDVNGAATNGGNKPDHRKDWTSSSSVNLAAGQELLSALHGGCGIDPTAAEGKIVLAKFVRHGAISSGKIAKEEAAFEREQIARGTTGGDSSSQKGRARGKTMHARRKGRGKRDRSGDENDDRSDL